MNQYKNPNITNFVHSMTFTLLLNSIQFTSTCFISVFSFAYYKYTFGGLPAFLYMWMSALVMNPAFYALLALTTSNYILQPFFMDCKPPVSAVRFFSVWVLGEYINDLYSSLLNGTFKT